MRECAGTVRLGVGRGDGEDGPPPRRGLAEGVTAGVSVSLEADGEGDGSFDRELDLSGSGSGSIIRPSLKGHWPEVQVSNTTIPLSSEQPNPTASAYKP
ncbi:hypothetical protein [Actinomadura sp. 3N407]|uniref:hypothetical protein n=1 Tax=Actinomadura sp. 3N407 TaxID=3457423 RepID=UPI003FCE7E61